MFLFIFSLFFTFFSIIEGRAVVIQPPQLQYVLAGVYMQSDSRTTFLAYRILIIFYVRKNFCSCVLIVNFFIGMNAAGISCKDPFPCETEMTGSGNSLHSTEGLGSNQQSVSRAGKVRKSTLPQEFQLFRVVKNVRNTHSSWLDTVPICEWSGVICEDGQAKEIYWGWRDLSGTIDFESLPHSLNAFSVCTNDLSGNVAFENLPQVQYFSLTKNAFSGTPVIEYLSNNLIVLFLSYNDLEGFVDFTTLPTSLKELWLRANEKLTGDLDIPKLPLLLQYDVAWTSITVSNGRENRWLSTPLKHGLLW